MNRRLGKYELLEELGTGAMARVFRARDVLLGREVALKVIDEELLRGADTARQRFLQEARVAALLNHPNIVLIYELGIEGEQPYIAMEYLPGRDLLDLMQDGVPMALGRKVNIALQVARALQHAHSRGVVHRDVKPANIRVLPGDLVKLVDFGIAKVLDSAMMQLTQSGIVVGSVSYMSPEQIRSEKLSPASDIFTFGIVLYEMLTGVYPFDAPTTASLVARLMEEEPPPIRVGNVPEELRSLVLGCLEKSRERRYASFEPIVQNLQQIQRRLREQRNEAARRASAPAPVRPDEAAPAPAPARQPAPADEAEDPASLPTMILDRDELDARLAEAAGPQQEARADEPPAVTETTPLPRAEVEARLARAAGTPPAAAQRDAAPDVTETTPLPREEVEARLARAALGAAGSAAAGGGADPASLETIAIDRRAVQAHLARSTSARLRETASAPGQDEGGEAAADAAEPASTKQKASLRRLLSLLPERKPRPPRD